MIRTGQKLVVYVPNGRAERYKNVNTATFAEKQRLTGQPAAVSSPASAPKDQEASASGDYMYYTVRSGDTLWDIAKKFPGCDRSGDRENQPDQIRGEY